MTSATHRPYRFSIQGGPFSDPVALCEHAQRIEELGFDELFAADHIGAPFSGGRGGGKYSVDPFTPLLIAASATTHLRLGTLVLNNEFYNPALLARTAASVDLLTGGRFVLGLGTGYAEAEHEAIGVPIRPPGVRVSRFGESLAILRSLLYEGTIEHRGEHELAARYADIFQFTGLTHGDGGIATGGGFAIESVTERADWLAAGAGDRNDSIERSSLVQHVSIGPDAPSVDVLAEQFELPDDVIADTPFILSGSMEQVVDKVGRLRDSVGITHYVVRDPEVFAPLVDALT